MKKEGLLKETYKIITTYSKRTPKKEKNRYNACETITMITTYWLIRYLVERKNI
jgi:hypothetical protein